MLFCMPCRTVYFGKPGDAAVSYVRALHGAPGITLTQQQLDSSSAWSHNAAEWMVDVFTQADREGRGGAFADAYEASKLKQVRLRSGPTLAVSVDCWLAEEVASKRCSGAEGQHICWLLPAAVSLLHQDG